MQTCVLRPEETTVLCTFTAVASALIRLLTSSGETLD